MKRFICALLALTLCLSMVACGNKAEPAGTIKEGLCYEATGISPDAVAMTVDGTEIPMDIYYYVCNRAAIYMEQMVAYYGLEFDWEMAFSETMTLEDAVREEAIFSAAQLATVENLAAKHNIVLSEEMAAEMDEARRAAIEEVGGEEIYAQLVSNMGLSAESYERIRRSQYLQAALQEFYLTEGSALYAGEEELVAFAEESGYMTADHILITATNPLTGELLPEEMIEGKRELAEEILAKIRAYEGDDLTGFFTEMADEYSEDPGHAAYPGGYTFGPGEMVTEFETAAAALKPGQVSEVVESPYGFHIILRKELQSDQILGAVRESYFLYLLDEATEKAAIVNCEDLDAIDIPAGYETFINYQSAAAEGEEAPAEGSEDAAAEGEESSAG